MLTMFTTWYKRRFSDPDAVALILIIIGGFGIIYFFGHLIVPLLVAIVLAYLLDWPVSLLQKSCLNRKISTLVVITSFFSLMLIALFWLIPSIWQQIVNLSIDMPVMLNHLQSYLLKLPEVYPGVIDAEFVANFLNIARDKIVNFGSSIISGSLTSILSLVSLTIYLILVPLLVFFLLKDKDHLVEKFVSLLPRNRRLANMVGQEMNLQIANYIRGKVLEIFLVGIATYLLFIILDMRYALLLSVGVGLSVLIPYIGAAAITVPVAIVALFQWGFTPDFWWLISAYLVIQAIDGNLLVPILFSEAVNLHPVLIITSVLFFGGLWGFWGIFFAIPLGTLVKAVFNALPSLDEVENTLKETK